jgi:hypothetical protein
MGQKFKNIYSMRICRQIWSWLNIFFQNLPEGNTLIRRAYDLRGLFERRTLGVFSDCAGKRPMGK